MHAIQKLKAKLAPLAQRFQTEKGRQEAIILLLAFVVVPAFLVYRYLEVGSTAFWREMFDLPPDGNIAPIIQGLLNPHIYNYLFWAIVAHMLLSKAFFRIVGPKAAAHPSMASYWPVWPTRITPMDGMLAFGLIINILLLHSESGNTVVQTLVFVVKVMLFFWLYCGVRTYLSRKLYKTADSSQG